jgi:phytanoyl-CoA hydroxylase
MRSINKIGHALFELNDTFHKFTNNPVNVQIAKQIFGMKQPVVAQSMVIFKQPKVGGHGNLKISHTS